MSNTNITLPITALFGNLKLFTILTSKTEDESWIADDGELEEIVLEYGWDLNELTHGQYLALADELDSVIGNTLSNVTPELVKQICDAARAAGMKEIKHR